MIYDLIANAGMYESVDSRLMRAIDFAKTLDPDTPDGKIEIDGDDLFGVVCSYETTPAEQRPFEAHKQYIDVQILLAGREWMDVTHASDLDVTQEYGADSDVELYAPMDNCSSLELTPVMFAVLWPQDVHRPGCSLVGDMWVRKLVLKIRVD